MYRTQAVLRTLLNKLSSREKMGSARACSQRAGDRQSKLNDLKFDNKVLAKLPIDREEENYIRTVHNAIYSLIKPTPLKNPKLVAFSRSALQLIGLDENDVDEEFILYFSGNKILNGSQTASQCYAGHQFGSFVGQLGDGAVIYLGEVINDRNQRWELQLKGAGLTPYSRGADGRKVMRSSIREFLCSEAMHCLGVPTTRAGSCITSDDLVTRDIYYNGNEIKERCTVISRMAESFIRFGTFEIFKTRDEFTGRFGPSVGRMDILEQLFDYVVETFYPKINSLTQDSNENTVNSSEDEQTASQDGTTDGQSDERMAKLRNLKCKEFFKEIVKRTATTLALWQCYGFNHGVLNSDNMSILGLTLDYGPFAFLEKYDPFHVANGSDHNGRYSFINQVTICRWNLFKLAEMLVHFTPLDELQTIQEEHFISTYKRVYLSKMRSKLGLFNELKEDADGVPCDERLVDSFLRILEATGSDLTNGFRNLNLLKNVDDEQLAEKQINGYIDLMMNENSLPFEELKRESRETFDSLNIQYCLRLMEESPENFKLLEKTSDKIKAFLNFIDRYEQTKKMTEEEKAKWDREKWQEFFGLYLRRIEYDLADKKPVDGEKFADEVLSARIELMNANNAKFILRNHLAEKAIAEAELDNTEEMSRLLRLLERPFDDPPEDACIPDLKRYYRMAKKEERRKQITCSS